LITLVPIAGTHIIHKVYYDLTDTELRVSEYIAGTIAPLIVASTIVSYLINLIQKLNDDLRHLNA